MKFTYTHITYSDELNTKFAIWLRVNPKTFSEDGIKISLQNRVDDTIEVINSILGNKILKEDVIIPKEVNNELYRVKRLYSSFMAKYNKI